MNPRLAAAAPQPSDMTPANGFAAWVFHGRPCDVCAYHHGFLVVDRDPEVSRLSAPARQALNAVADLALAFAEAGRVLLVQERLGDGAYRYLAVIASQQKHAARPRSRPIAMATARQMSAQMADAIAAFLVLPHENSHSNSKGEPHAITDTNRAGLADRRR